MNTPHIKSKNMSKPNEIHILVSELNNRVHFLLRHVLIKMMGLRPMFTNDKEDFVACDVAKINYSRQHIEGVFNIQPYGLLYEKGVRKQNINVTKHNGVPIIFQTEESDLPFDVFSAVFYFITRYEEYFNFSADKYGRFEANQSIAYANGFIEEPVVEQWVGILETELLKRYPHLQVTKPAFNHIPTIDVDSAFAYLHKGLSRTVAATVKNFFSSNFKEIGLRTKTLSGHTKDPFDNFSYLTEKLSTLSGHKPQFFFLSGNYGKLDKNIPIQNRSMVRIVSDVSAYANIGLHPSYASNKKPSLIDEEKGMLEKTANIAIDKSRQHFIKLYFPKTYLNLIKSGICEDFSMGYASMPGFRAGTSVPFNFYDLSKEKETHLKVYPFQTMDATYATYLKMTPEHSQESILKLMDKVKKWGGTFVTIWHNDTFAPDETGLKWRKVFENVLEAAGK